MNLQFSSYKISFKGGFKTARGNLRTRNGVIIQLQKNGFTALGEAAPLPDFSDESFEQLTEQIYEKRSSVTGLFKTDFTLDDVDEFIRQTDLFPSLQFGLFTAAAFYLAQKNRQSLHHFLFGQTNRQINLNAVINLNESIFPQVHKHVKAGFKTIKLKTGTNWQRDITHIKKLRGEFSSLQIRVDVNQSLTLDEAKQFLKQLEPLQIEYCEEPLQRPSPESLKMLTQYTSTPVALDETMAYGPNTMQLAWGASVLIIKPMVIGGHENINAVCNFAVKQNKKVIFTTSLGTGIERLMTATLAAGLGSKDTAHGLNTAGLLETDIWNDENFVQNGIYTLPDFKQLKQLMQSDLRPLSPEIL